MKKTQPKARNFKCRSAASMAIAVGLAFLLSACGDDSSSSASDLSGPESSSVESSSDDEGVSSSSSTKKATNSSAMSSSSVKSSSSVESSGGDGEWNVSKESFLNPKIEYGGMTDDRDGQVYKTVEICDEDKSLCQTWMAENLNFKSAKSYCYDDVDANCAVAGRLYVWDSASEACPEGWHLPTDQEFETLFKMVEPDFERETSGYVNSAVAGTKLKSKEGWMLYKDVPAGSDDYGFSAIPAGIRDGSGVSRGVDEATGFWSSTMEMDGYATEVALENEKGGVYVALNRTNVGLSVRCILSTPAPIEEPASSSSVQSSSSVSSSSGGWSWDVPKESFLNSEIEYGEMTDIRDGQVYKTVTIGDGANAQTWMAENLNYADSINTVSLKGKSWCYVNKDENCAVAGRLYTWAAAIDSAALANDADNPQECGYGKKCSLPTVVQGICPSGWHLPSYDDWMALFTAVGGQDKAGSALKSLTGWESFDGVPAGNDAYGFSVLPAGNGANGTSFDDAGKASNFWSASQGEGAGYGANGMVLYYDKELADLDYLSKFYAYSIRCLKD